MLIDLTDGLLLEGDEDELRGLAEDLVDAADDGEARAAILTNDGVATVLIRRTDHG